MNFKRRLYFDFKGITSYNAFMTVIEGLPSKVLTYVAAFSLIGLIWAANFYYIGREMTFSVTYLIPIAWITWRAGRAGGVILALASAIAWLSIDALQNPYFGYSFLTFISVITKVVLFLSYVFILAKLKDLLQREQELSRTDRLTGIANRWAFLENLGREMKRSQRSMKPITVVYMDVDNFKTINDLYGHHKGDECLLLLAETISDQLRSTDTVARMGGDEFAILLPELGYDDAYIVLTKIRERVKEMANNKSWDITLSMGAVTYSNPQDPDTIDEIIKLSDSLMYDVKQSGKNGIKRKVL